MNFPVYIKVKILILFIIPWLFIFILNILFLGLGDIVMPGLLLCFVLRYDAYKKSQGLSGSRLTYFHCSLLGYFLGLLTATVSSEMFKAAQPALLYLVPFTLLPLLTMAYLKVYEFYGTVYSLLNTIYFTEWLRTYLEMFTSHAPLTWE